MDPGVKLSAAIMAHPARSTFVDELLGEIPDVPVVWDERGDRWDTGRRALLAYDPSCSRHLIVQDDAVLCRDFLAGAALAASFAGHRPVALYTGRVQPHLNIVAPRLKRARRHGIPWLAFEGPWWGVAVIVPTADIPSLIAWADRHAHIRNYDRRIAKFYAEAKVDCWYSVPSLVDHRPVDENPSLIPGRTANRQAHWFIGREDSPLDIDWSRPPLGIRDAAALERRALGRAA
jgi:hypothetical protein